MPTVGSPGTVQRDNLSLMRSLVREMGVGLVDRYGQNLPDTLILDVDSSAPAWIVRSELFPLLSSGGRRILTSGDPGDGRTLWSVHGIRIGVTYSNIRKPGIFSEALVDREIRAEFTTEITGPSAIIGSLTTSRVSRDTLRENDVESMENGEMEFTRGTVPDLDSWDRFIEPFVIIGAAGTAIFLFFQVRS